MTLEQWAELPMHPRQRNTERHSKARHWKAAAVADGAIAAVLRHVAAAELDGRLYKVDGHTRTLLWLQGKLPAPETVIVTVFHVRDETELLSLYSVFDAPSAAEHPTDQIFGAYRQHGIEITSPRLRSGQITVALGIALLGRSYKPARHTTRRVDPYVAVGIFREELQNVDRFRVDWQVFASGVLATALLCLALHPQQTEFWELLSKRQGTKQQGTMDPIEAVLQEINAMRNAKKSAVARSQVELAGRTMRAFQAWLHREEPGNQYWFSNRIRELDLDPYIAEVKALKGCPQP